MSINQVPGLPEGFYYGLGMRSTAEGTLSVPVYDPHGIEVCTVVGKGWAEINEKAAPIVKGILGGTGSGYEGQDRCDKCGLHISKWGDQPKCDGATVNQSTCHKITRFHIPLPSPPQPSRETA